MVLKYNLREKNAIFDYKSCTAT